MTRAQRDNWIRQCTQRLKCQQWQVDAIIEGAAPGPERERATRVSFAAAAQDIAREHGKDGSDESVVPIGVIAGMMARPNVGLAMLELMPQVALADAKKEPASARGSVIKVSGTIVEIRKDKSLTEGALMTGNMTVVRFVTPLPTTNVYPESWATFVGVFVQEFAYPNVSGGETRSLLAVGAFDLPENRTIKNLPEPPRQ